MQGKFRVYDTELKKYVSREFINQAFVNMDGEFVWFSYKGIEQPPEGRFIVEWFTGRLDKNKKEIYEGDIIRGIYQKSSRHPFVDPICWDEVYFEDNEYYLRKNGTLLDCIVNPEIFGNIRENPELLK